MKRSCSIRAIGCLTLASISGCSNAAHSLGGDELHQQIAGNGDAGVAPETDSSAASPSCGSCADVVASYGGQAYTFAGCCLPSGTCGIDVGVAADWVHANVVTSPASNTEVRLSIARGCQPLDQVGVPDTSCPSMGAVLTNEFEGCCRSDGTCGTNLGLIHVGCVQAQRQLTPLGEYVDGGPLPSPLPPQTCSYPN